MIEYYLLLILNMTIKKLTATLLLNIGIFFTIWIVLKTFFIDQKLPPGPWGWPYFGSLLSMYGKAPHLWFMELSATYGEIFSLRLGTNRVVCVASPSLLRELFSRVDSTGRPHTPLNGLLGGKGILTSEGQLWKRQRQFLYEKFRSLGIRYWKDQPFEKLIIMEIQELHSILEQTRGTPVDPVCILSRHVHNIICQLMMSFRFENNDPIFQEFNENISKSMKLFGSVHIGEHIPAYLKIPGKQQIMNEIKRQLRAICKFHAEHIDSRRQERLVNHLHQKKPRDILDYYLSEIDQESKKKQSIKLFPDVCPDEQLVQVMNDLFSAGMETSRTTLLWTFLMMVRELKVAKRVQAELANVVSVGELVTLNHRQRLSYLEAVIYETLRIASVVPLGTTHVNTDIWNVKDYIIPKGCHIMPLIVKINMDPELFPEPEKFKPERFMKDDVICLPDYFLPFGVGRRICLGEQLAKMELFLFFANVMNTFDLKIPVNESVPGLQGHLGVTHTPLPFNLVFEKRRILNKKKPIAQVLTEYLDFDVGVARSPGI